MTQSALDPSLGADVVAVATHLDRGRTVLRLEAAALEACARGLDGAFATAVDTLLGIGGRVVVTGMGKSGHVARKIAATLASTGTPAFFVHPAEASHGDLGMVARGDAVLALSNSGETPELRDILVYAKRFSIPLLAIVGRAPSALADAADVTLQLPPLREACPIGMAPTTSTTVMLALGDALAAALLAAKGFERRDFAVFHPGGKLGSRLVRVRDVMHGGDAVPLITPERPMRDAILEMTNKRLGCVGVIDAGSLIGIVTDGDLRRQMERPGFFDLPVAEVMSAHPRLIQADALAVEALAAMEGPPRAVTQLFVVEAMDQCRPVGVIHLHDCLEAGVA
ncbi:MAG: KpsF/GutQ family sugar-phosphate isomerase [Geminicoccaceae bacterium]|nr:MAG: KpsF/GutQ family sugar-phosphate isomerase [Geminicoccaceae bacterium]